MSYRVLTGHVLDRLREMPDESVQCSVTSPPYWGLRDYGVDGQIGLEKTPEEYIARMVEVFREVRRVLRVDGTLWINIGDSYASSPNQRKVGDGDTVGYKQASNVGSRMVGSRSVAGLKPKDLVGIPWMLAFALRTDGWYLRQDIIWAKPNPMPESVTDRCTRAHEYVFLLSKSQRYFYDADAIKEPCVADHEAGNQTHNGLTAYEAGYEKHRTKQGLVAYAQRQRGEQGSWNGSKFHDGKNAIAHPNVGKNRKTKVPGGWDTGDGAHGTIHRSGRTEAEYVDTPLSDKRNKRSVWEIATQAFPEAHFATFPEKLVEPCILAGSRLSDTVLDPFCGSGTTGVVALRYQRSFIGIELNHEYVEMAHRRIQGDAPLLNVREDVEAAAV